MVNAKLLLDVRIKAAKEAIKTHNSLHPILELSDGRVFALEWTNREEKTAVLYRLRENLKEIKPEYVLFVADSWVSEKSPINEVLRPNLDPDRKSAIVAFFISKNHAYTYTILYEKGEFDYEFSDPKIEETTGNFILSDIYE